MPQANNTLYSTKNIPFPEWVVIVEVKSLNDTHIYERAMWEAYNIIVPFIKQHKNAEWKNTFMGDVEYYLYGLTYLVGGIFSRGVFEQYISAVNVRVAKHRETMLGIYAHTGITLNFNSNSPFRNLDLSGKSAKEVIDTFIRLFSDKGVNTLEGLCDNIANGDITLNDLLIKLKESFNSDDAIAALKTSNRLNQQYIKSKKAQVKAKKSASNSEDFSELLDEVGIDLSVKNLNLQDKINPWRLENFEPEVHNLVEGKEKHPTPSQMFSIVSNLSEVARVMMSVIQNPKKRVCVILESHQERTLKLFKELFTAHAKKICAYVYQLPISTLGRPLYHEEDCSAVTGNLITKVSQLYYLNENARGELKSKLDSYSEFCNNRFDTYILNYMRSVHKIDDLLSPYAVKGIRVDKLREE